MSYLEWKEERNEISYEYAEDANVAAEIISLQLMLVMKKFLSHLAIKNGFCDLMNRKLLF